MLRKKLKQPKNKTSFPLLNKKWTEGSKFYTYQCKSKPLLQEEPCKRPRVISGIKTLNRNNKKNCSTNFSKSWANSKPSYSQGLVEELDRLYLPLQDKKLALNAEKLQRFLFNFWKIRKLLWNIMVISKKYHSFLWSR